MMKALLTLVLLVAGTFTASAGERTIKLSVPGMYCAACPYIVEETIASVDGVESVNATIEGKSATVTFDDTRTGADAILSAMTGIGYPATIIEPSS